MKIAYRELTKSTGKGMLSKSPHLPWLCLKTPFKSVMGSSKQVRVACAVALMDNVNRPYSYSRSWTGSSMKWRLLRGNLFICKCIPPQEPPLHARSSSIHRTRIWPIERYIPTNRISPAVRVKLRILQDKDIGDQNVGVDAKPVPPH